MSWDSDIRSAESMLMSSHIHSSLDIISLIKRINPTMLALPDADRERGYDLKNKLQNLLLENYGECFLLDPHPYHPDIILIKHRTLPGIDACHSCLNTLSPKALDAVSEPSVPAPEPGASRQPKAKQAARPPAGAGSAKELVKKAQLLLDDYAYDEAQELLSGLRVRGKDELPDLLRAARMLAQEMGAYGEVIETVLAQPKQLLQDKSVRELLAMAYYDYNMQPEARVIFDSLSPPDLDKAALCAYADISLRDGNLRLAARLLELAEQKEGFVSAFANLRQAVDELSLKEAAPLADQALALLAKGELAAAEALAHEALAISAHCARAGEVLRNIASGRLETETSRLWDRLEASVSADDRLALLNRLLECDRNNQERVKELIAVEKARRRSDLIQARVRDLQAALEREDWPRCFDLLHWLARQEEHPEQSAQAYSLSPLFSVLNQNKQLRRVSDAVAREAWLGFIKVKERLCFGKREGCLQAMIRIRPYFQGYPEFEEDYLALLTAEQDQARAQAEELVRRVMADDCCWEEAGRIAARLRSVVTALPVQERARYYRVAEERLQCLKPASTEDAVITEYREAMQWGRVERSAWLRERITDKEAVEAIDAELARSFQIAAEPVAVSLSGDLEVDLYKEAGPLTKMGSTERHVLLRQDDENVILLNLKEMRATRFRSASFANLELLDALPGADTYLFLDKAGCTTLWRAQLTDGAGSFTARFDMYQAFQIPDEMYVDTAYLSSVASDHYYLSMTHWRNETPARLEKHTFHQGSRPLRTLNGGQRREVDLHRLAYDEDKFLVNSTGCLGFYNKNLTRTSASEYDPDTDCCLCRVDIAGKNLYLIYDGKFQVHDLNFTKLKEFDLPPLVIVLKASQVEGISPDAGTLLVHSFDKTVKVVDLRTGQWSKTFPQSNILCSTVQSRFFAFGFDSEQAKLELRDISDHLDSVVVWEEDPYLNLRQNLSAQAETEAAAPAPA